MSSGAAYFGIAVHDGKIGVLDIGSNSVRLVIYDGMKRAPMPVFNEKVLCELGKNLVKTGKLNPEGADEAKKAIARYMALARVMNVVELYVLATAAVRDASDGKRFVRDIEDAHQITVEVISGKGEAQLAAKGIQASIHQPDGLVGDLGGGSFELVSIVGGKLADQTSLPIGALRLLDESGGRVAVAALRVSDELEKLGWLQPNQFQVFYAVGGSFRALSHIHLLQSGYPLEVLHGYEVNSADLLPFLKEIAAMKPEAVGELPGSSRKRAPQLAYAATALIELLKHTGIPKVVFSTAGIREGYLYDQLSPYLKQEDGLIACCVDLASQNGRLETYARDVFHWLSGIFEQDEDESRRRLRFACCVLSEFAWRIHPQYRAEWQFTRIIQSSFIGVNHPERVALALTLYHRHKLKTAMKNPKVLRLLSREDQLWCQAVGQAMGIGFAMSGGMHGVLPKSQLVFEDGKLNLIVAPDVQDMLTDAVHKRLSSLEETVKAWRSKSK